MPATLFVEVLAWESQWTVDVAGACRPRVQAPQRGPGPPCDLPLLGEDLCRSADQVRDDCVEAPVVLLLVRPSIRLQDWSVRIGFVLPGPDPAGDRRLFGQILSVPVEESGITDQSAIIYTLLGYATAKRVVPVLPVGTLRRDQVREPVLGAPDIAPHLADSRECLFEPTHDTPLLVVFVPVAAGLAYQCSAGFPLIGADVVRVVPAIGFGHRRCGAHHVPDRVVVVSLLPLAAGHRRHTSYGVEPESARFSARSLHRRQTATGCVGEVSVPSPCATLRGLGQDLLSDQVPVRAPRLGENG
ncbi:hypothetical protein STENM36S_01838 [Streptomyces tendae]